MSREESYRDAVARAAEARRQLVDSATALRDRVAPSELSKDVKHKIAAMARNGVHSVEDKVRQRPVATAAAAGAFVLFLARRPIWALLRKLHVRSGSDVKTYSEDHHG